VPYFSWQRSHALHHANTNHISDGETHVPPIFTAATTTTDKLKLQKLFGLCAIISTLTLLFNLSILLIK